MITILRFCYILSVIVYILVVICDVQCIPSGPVTTQESQLETNDTSIDKRVIYSDVMGPSHTECKSGKTYDENRGCVQPISLHG